MVFSMPVSKANSMKHCKFQKDWLSCHWVMTTKSFKKSSCRIVDTCLLLSRREYLEIWDYPIKDCTKADPVVEVPSGQPRKLLWSDGVCGGLVGAQTSCFTEQATWFITGNAIFHPFDACYTSHDRDETIAHYGACTKDVRPWGVGGWTSTFKANRQGEDALKNK